MNNERAWLHSYPEGVPFEIMIPNRTVIDFLDRAVANRKKHPALMVENTVLTYEQFGELINRLATGLHSIGVQKGTRVALMMNNSRDLVLSYFAVLRLGAIVVQNNPMYKERELVYQLNDSGAEFLIIEEKLTGNFKNLEDKTSIIKQVVARTSSNVHDEFVTVDELISKHPPNPPEVEIDPKDDVAVLQYTGGTTGVSKGVMLTHYNLIANVVQTKEFMGVYCKEGQERILNVLPLFHVYGMTVSMNLSVFLESTLYLMERFSAKEVLETIHQEKITMFPGTPTIYVGVNNDPKVSEYDLSSVHTCISGSAPLPAEIKQTFERLTGAKLVDAYGLSEASPVTHSNPVNGKRVMGSMGLPLPNTDCKIVSIEDGETEMPLNQPGELIIKGPQVMKGYWNRQEETDLSLKDGWLYTGDIAYMNEEGYCFIVSRKKDVIIAGGYNIFPRDVEEVIFEHPAVQEVVVVGIPDSYRGETVKAFIVIKDGHAATEKDILDFCSDKLAKYKLPRFVEFRSELPKTTVGKILRRTLVQEELAK